eukprot:CAMPEP_0114667264 /NCGR_PEP_ID=MMETSP0191-20121206/34063_1 /TAXON_ID=126664 /ORGANISM="Sorites sp." /LENGTH=103 /DNA_ID=CAMNT_0001917091 /DNA_START=968 /DNA_END=1279 /DNA_ORIENTATION=-
MSIHQPASPQSEVQFSDDFKEDSTEIIEGIPVTGDGIQADYQIKALENTSIYTDKKVTPSTKLSVVDGIRDIIAYADTPRHNIANENISTNGVNEIELVYSND